MTICKELEKITIGIFDHRPSNIINNNIDSNILKSNNSNLISIKKSNLTDLNIYYQNVRGLRTKTKSVLSNSLSMNFDVYALTETWLTSSINSLELFDKSFIVFRKDRYNSQNLLSAVNTAKGGGVLVAIKSKFNVSEILIPNSESLEIVGVEVNLQSKKLIIISYYIPPNSNLEVYSNFNKAIDSITSELSSSDELIICGDFNLPNITWLPHDEEPFLTPRNLSNEIEYSFCDNLAANYMQQISNIKNFQSKQLDLIFTSDWDNIILTQFVSTLVNIDQYHPPITFTYCYNAPIAVASANSYRFNFNKTDFQGLNAYLHSFDFNTLNDNVDYNEVIENFYNIILHGFNLFVPKSIVKGIDNSPPWFTHEIKKLRNIKNKAWRKYLKSKNNIDYINFTNLFNIFKQKVDQSYNSYVDDMSFKLVDNPKAFWNFVNSKRKSDQFPTFMSFNGNLSNDPAVISNYFREHFSDCYLGNNFKINESHFDHLENSPKTTLQDIIFDEILTKSYLDKLGNNASPGPDGIPEIILKNCSSSLTLPLTILFKRSLATGIFPYLWKKSYIKPIHKKGSKKDVLNYRPIAKLSCIPKLFELMVFDNIYDHCLSFLVANQHGFMKSRSTVTNLVESTSIFINNMEAGYQTDVLFSDLSKAFDLLPHSVILFKLRKLGFPKYFLKWIESYLTNRTYSILFKSIVTSAFEANSGVPQGSHLGPLLFIISINDVVSLIKNSNISIYADDMKIYRKITSMSDSISLQEDMNRFSTWCTSNCLKLNVGKCAMMTFSRKKTPIQFNYKLNNETVPIVESFRDLGIYLDQNLNFKLHYNYIINKSNSMLGFIKRWSKEFSDPYILKSLYTCLVRPNLEYASQVWNPHFDIHIRRIERIQRNFIRFAFRQFHWINPLILPPYVDRIKLINMQTLEKRREMADVVFLNEIINSNIDSSFLLNKIEFNHDNRFRSPNLFNLKFHRTTYGMFEPINRLLILGNKYQNYIRISTSKNNLKKLILND